MSTKTVLTSDDLWKIVADGSRYELSQGELVPRPPPYFLHGVVAGSVGTLLSKLVHEKRLGLVCCHAGFTLHQKPDTVRAPDVAFISRDRLPAEGIPEKFADFPPDLAVEVLSPEDTASEILRKVEEYLTAGTRLVWVVDPATQRVTVYRSLQDVKVLTTEQELDGGEVLPGFRTPVAELFNL